MWKIKKYFKSVKKVTSMIWQCFASKKYIDVMNKLIIKLKEIMKETQTENIIVEIIKEQHLLWICEIIMLKTFMINTKYNENIIKTLEKKSN